MLQPGQADNPQRPGAGPVGAGEVGPVCLEAALPLLCSRSRDGNVSNLHVQTRYRYIVIFQAGDIPSVCMMM